MYKQDMKKHTADKQHVTFIVCNVERERERETHTITTPKYLKHQQATVCCYVGKTQNSLPQTSGQKCE